MIVKGHILAKDPVRAKSRTEWNTLGYKVLDEAEPHGWFYSQSNGRSFHYAVFREDQVVSKKKRRRRPPIQVPILAALWTLNRRAKRARDLAQLAYRRGMHGFSSHRRKEKDRCYQLKEQTLHWLLEQDLVRVVGYHRFNPGGWAEVLEGDGYRFHRPCPDEDVPEEIIANPIAHVLDAIEAKPRSAQEPRLVDALHTVERYLEGRPDIECFS